MPLLTLNKESLSRLTTRQANAADQFECPGNVLSTSGANAMDAEVAADAYRGFARRSFSCCRKSCG